MGLAVVSVWVEQRGRRAGRGALDRRPSWRRIGVAALLAYVIAALFVLDPVPSLAANVFGAPSICASTSSSA